MIKILGGYRKTIGLANYSSHQFSVSVETEISDVGDIQQEASKLYAILQNSVDHEIQQTGFVPGESHGLPKNSSVHQNGNGSGHSPKRANLNGNGQVRWSCSDKQKDYIKQIIAQNDLDLESVEEIAFDRFGVGLRQLNKLQASGLIDELLSITGKQQRSAKGGKR